LLKQITVRIRKLLQASSDMSYLSHTTPPLAIIPVHAGSREEILSFLRSERDRVYAAWGLSGIWLAGSFARNEAGPESDVDIVIEFQQGTVQIYEKKQNLQLWLEASLGRKVDLLRMKYLHPILKPSILRDAIPV
jgi:uncharacterized protein